MKLAHYCIYAAQRLIKPPKFFANQVPNSHPTLHAKALASEKTSIIGSHNLIATGVRFGTAEISLERREADFANTVRSLILREVT